MSAIGPMEVVVVAIIALLVLGPKKLPEAGRSLGRGIREFKTGITDHHDRDEDAAELEPASARSTNATAATATEKSA